VKILLRQAMHHVNRKGRAESLLAEERGKSRDENFLDHQRNVIKARNEAIVDIFNLVLGRGTRSEEFWNGMTSVFHNLCYACLTLCFTGVLSDAVKSKFNLTMPSFLASSAMLSSVQLFHALGYHCGVSFSSDKDYDFSVHDPFKYEDLSSYRPKVKSSTSYPGSQHSPIAVAAAMMQERMFQDALSLLRIHTSSLMIMNSGNDTLEFVSPMLSYQHLYSGYLMGLCLFYVKNYESSIALLQSYKDMAPKKSLMEARLITLLMAAQFKYKNSASDSVKVSLDSFEKGSVVYSEALGLKHPYHGLHVNALADLYFLVQALPQAKATLMIAFELFQAALGHMHPVCAGVLTKIGILLMMQGQVTPAIETFSSALLVYEEINKICSEEGSADATKTVYVDDQSHCMHALAAALNIKGDTKAATSTAFKAIDIVTTAGRMITPAITHNLLLLAELLELGGDYSAAVTLYQDVWDVVKQSPKSYHMSAMLVDLASRLIHATIDSLPLTSRVLLETIRADREAVDGKTWSSIISTVCDEFWNEEPCTYVAKIISQGLEIASTGGAWVLKY
jgi:tetratricopeptide (TPR) repeat protein